MLQCMGVRVNQRAHKRLPPAQIILFTGVQVNTILCRLELDSEKLHRLSEALAAWTQKTGATRRELQKLAGLLQWAARVVYGGRTFIRRLFDAVRTVDQAHHHIHITAEMRLDLDWWQQHLHACNGWVGFLDPVAMGRSVFQTCQQR